MGFHELNEILRITVVGKRPVDRTFGVDNRSHFSFAQPSSGLHESVKHDL